MKTESGGSRGLGGLRRRRLALLSLLILLVGVGGVVRLGVLSDPPTNDPLRRAEPVASAPGVTANDPESAAETETRPGDALPERRSGELETVPWGDEAGTGALTGRVVKAGDGTPCSNVPVVLAEAERSAIWALLTERPGARGCRTRTDEEGRFRFLGLPPGDYDVGANPMDAPPVTSPAFEVEEACETRVRIVVPPGKVLHGRVIHERTGAPVAEARVSVRLSPGVVVETDEEGRFVLPGVSKLLTTVLVQAPGYPVHEFRRFESLSDRLVGEFVVGEGGSISGRVQDADGEAVVGAWISVSVSPDRAEGEAERPWTRPVRSGPDGGFTLTGLPAGMDHPLFVRAEGYALGVSPQAVRFQSSRFGPRLEASAILRVASPGAHVQDVVITLRPSGSLVLEVVDESGRVIEGAKVEGWERLADQLDRWFGEGVAEETDPEGRLRISELPAGPCELLVKAYGYCEARARVVIEAGRLTKSRVVLSKGDALEGRVVYPEGEGGMPELEILPVVGPRQSGAAVLGRF